MIETVENDIEEEFMTIGEFNRFKTICKKEWTQLAERQWPWKSSGVYRFLNECPACEISMRARKANGHRKQKRGRGQYCVLCPIDKWREAAVKQKRKKKAMFGAVCEERGELYYVWLYTLGDVRKQAAKEISKLSWTFLPEYEKI